MATDSVLGLFADPQQYQMQQQQAALQRGVDLAQLDPFQRASAQMYQAGYMGGGALAGALGGQDPQLQAMSTRQQVLKDFDLNTVEGITGASNALRQRNDLQGAYMLAQRADEAALKESQIAKNMREGKPAVPAEIQGYQVALSQGYKGSFVDYKKELARAGATSVSVDTKGENKFSETVGTELGKNVIASKTGAEDAAIILKTNEVGRQLLDSGAITGTGAKFFTGFNGALKQAGIDLGYGDAAANTQAYAASMGANVGKIIKQFGAGTGLSDADRQYAERIAAGDVTLDEKAIRRILDINDKASRNVIESHNKKVANIKAPMPLTVEMPTMRPAPPQNNIPTTGGLTGNALVDKYRRPQQ
jgi:hypothetical protein